MLVLRLLVMVLTIICLMDGHAEVSSTTTGIRDRRESPAVKTNDSEVEILDRKKKKKPKPGKKKKPKPGKKKKPNKKTPVTPTPTVSTSTMKTTTILTTPTVTTTVTTTTTTVSPTTTATTAKTTTSTASATTTLSTTTSATTSATTTTVATSSTASTTITTIPTTATTSSPPTTAATTADSGAGGECKATNGKPCIFPFKDGKEYNECKNEGGKYFWCATSVYDSGKYKHWSYCSTNGPCPLEGDDGECRATNNKPCVFPFKDGNKEYNECADHGGKYFWCATGTNSAGKYTAWSECPKDGSCPLPQKNTSPEMTSTSTTSPNTGTTIATDQMEEKVLDTLESLVLGESRDDSLQMAHMLNKTLDTIIKTLEEEKSKSERSNVGSLNANGEIRNASADGRVRGISQLGDGRMFDLSTVDSMKSVGRESDDCCTDCGRKDPNTKLVEYWEELDTCYCYQKKINTDGSEMEPQTWESSEFSTKKCEQSDCGYNSNVDPNRLVAEQNSAYLLNTMDDVKYTDVFEVLNWNQGFGNPKINVALLDDFESKISSGYYMLFLVPASVSCDKTIFDETQQRQFPIHMNSFTDMKSVEDDLNSLIGTLESESPHWMSTIFVEANPHICMLIQPTYLFVALNRVQHYTMLFNFAMESGRNFDKFFPFKQCSTKSLTISAMDKIAEEGYEDVSFEESEKSMDESDGLLTVKLTKKSGSTLKTIVFVETEIGTANEDDFIKFTGLVVFEKNQRTAVLFIHINMDNNIENEEYFYLTMKPIGYSSGTTKANNEIKIYLTEFSGPVVEMNNNNLRDYDELIQRMKGSIVIQGTFFDGIELTPSIISGGYEDSGVQILHAQETSAGKHNVVMFKSQDVVMQFYDDIAKKGQTIITMPKPLPRHLKVSPGVTPLTMFDGQYLPWMKNTIALRRIVGTDEAFTAQISGCGIRLFEIEDNTGLHTYLSHDNAYNLGGGCPMKPDFKAALSSFSAHFHLNFRRIRWIANVHPVHIELPTPGIDSTEYGLYENVGLDTSDRQELYVGRASASAVFIKDGTYDHLSGDQWCLALQRSIMVYKGDDLTSKGVILNFKKAWVPIDIPHPTPDKDEMILVTKPIGNTYGYELLCHDHTTRVRLPKDQVSLDQQLYWYQQARIVTIKFQRNGIPKTATRIYIFDDSYNYLITSGDPIRYPKLMNLVPFSIP